MSESAGFQVQYSIHYKYGPSQKRILRWILKIQVAYEVRSTSLGKGVFVLEEVKQGSLIWRYVHKRKNQQPWSDLIEQKLSLRYKKGENVICFNGEEETLAHMEMLTSYEERQPKRK